MNLSLQRVKFFAIEKPSTMIKFKSFFIILILTINIGCQSTQSKIHSFIKDYNAVFSSMDMGTIKNSKAKYVNSLEIDLLFNMVTSEGSQGLVVNMLPSTICQLLKQFPKFNDLVNDGINFKTIVVNDKMNTIWEGKINKRFIDSLAKVPAVNTNYNAELNRRNINPELKEMLKILNQSLPYEDKMSKTIIKQIDISDDKSLVYNIVVEQEFGNLVKENENAKIIMKESILSNSQMKKVLKDVEHLGIKTITVIYQTNKGDEVLKLKLTLNEFQ